MQTDTLAALPECDRRGGKAFKQKLLLRYKDGLVVCLLKDLTRCMTEHEGKVRCQAFDGPFAP